MPTTRPLALAVLALWIAATAPVATARPGDPISDLVRAYQRGDRDALVRRALAATTAELSAALGSSERLTVLAAARAATHADSPWLHLTKLAELSRSPDRPIAVAAARSARTIASSSEHTDVLWRGVPLDQIRRQLKSFRTIAADPGRWTDVRVLALETAVRLHQQLGKRAAPDDAPFDLSAMLTEPDAELRRAAIELAATPHQADQRQLIGNAVAADPDPLIAAVAAHVLCEELAFGGDAKTVVAAIGQAGIERLRDLMDDGAIPLASRRGAARCLVAEGSRASVKAAARLPGGALR